LEKTFDRKFKLNLLCHDRVGIVHQLSDYFQANHMNVSKLISKTFAAPIVNQEFKVGYPMFELDIVCEAKGKIQLSKIQ
jgi:glycine cleavage system regulatory protein